MKNDRLPPLIDKEVDLRDFPFMPVEIMRLRRSRAWSVIAKRDPRLGFYMHNLWCESWHERPAGSLPNDDDILCELAMSADMQTWRSIKEKVMHGWVLCSDNRWYHPTVCEKAAQAWARKVQQRARTERARASRAANRGKRADDSEAGPIQVEERPAYSPPAPSTPRKPDVEQIEPVRKVASPPVADLLGDAVPEADKPTGPKRAMRLPSDWTVPEEWREDAAAARQRHGMLPINLDLEAEKFANHFIGSGNANSAKKDWKRTWLNWCLSNKGKATIRGRNDAPNNLAAAISRLMPEERTEAKSLLDLGPGILIEGTVVKDTS